MGSFALAFGSLFYLAPVLSFVVRDEPTIYAPYGYECEEKRILKRENLRCGYEWERDVQSDRGIKCLFCS